MLKILMTKYLLVFISIKRFEDVCCKMGIFPVQEECVSRGVNIQVKNTCLQNKNT